MEEAERDQYLKKKFNTRAVKESNALEAEPVEVTSSHGRVFGVRNMCETSSLAVWILCVDVRSDVV